MLGVSHFHNINAGYVEGKRIYFKNLETFNRDVTIETAKGEKYTPLTYESAKIHTTGPRLLEYIYTQLNPAPIMILPLAKA